MGNVKFTKNSAGGSTQEEARETALHALVDLGGSSNEPCCSAKNFDRVRIHWGAWENIARRRIEATASSTEQDEAYGPFDKTLW